MLESFFSLSQLERSNKLGHLFLASPSSLVNYLPGAYPSRTPYGKLLILPSDIRLSWKSFPETNIQAYFASSQVTKKKTFIRLIPAVTAWPWAVPSSWQLRWCRCPCLTTASPPGGDRVLPSVIELYGLDIYEGNNHLSCQRCLIISCVDWMNSC